jgi:thioredoxin-related protein
MAKKALLTSLLTLLFALVLFMVYSIVETRLAKQEIQSKINSVPSGPNFFELDSTRFSFPVSRKIVLVLFNSTCEHCQYELAQVKENTEFFQDTELVFLSAEPIVAIKQVSEAFGQQTNVSFVKVNPDDLYDNFGTVRYPTILIYGADGGLIKEFKGETKIEAILQYVR